MTKSDVRQRVGVFGGTFDPIHWGHLLVAEQLRDILQLDLVLFVPAHRSPFKPQRRPAPDKARAEMIRLAISGNPAFQLDPRELQREGLSYTVDTLRELSQEHPDWQLHLLLGADAVVGFDRWKEPQEICRLASIHVVSRGGHPAPDLQDIAPFLFASNQVPAACIVEVPQVEISSSDIRRRIAQGQTIRYLVHPAVEAYLAAHQLYTDGKAAERASKPDG